MKKPKCLICNKPASIKKEVLIALSYLNGQFKSTDKILDFCALCFPHVTPVFICGDE